MSFIFLTLEIIIVILVTDILGAFGHWFMDSYGNPNTPLVGPHIFQPNIDHHKDPDALIKNGWLELISTSILPVLLIDAIIWMVWEINWQVLLGSFILANANIIHKWCHCSRESIPWFVNMLHKLNILQTPSNHALHHLGNQDNHYAAITNITNPLLEYFAVWRRLEYVVFRLTKIQPKSDVRISKKKSSIADI